MVTGATLFTGGGGVDLGMRAAGVPVTVMDVRDADPMQFEPVDRMGRPKDLMKQQLGQLGMFGETVAVEGETPAKPSRAKPPAPPQPATTPRPQTRPEPEIEQVTGEIRTVKIRRSGWRGRKPYIEDVAYTYEVRPVSDKGVRPVKACVTCGGLWFRTYPCVAKNASGQPEPSRPDQWCCAHCIHPVPNSTVAEVEIIIEEDTT